MDALPPAHSWSHHSRTRAESGTGQRGRWSCTRSGAADEYCRADNQRPRAIGKQLDREHWSLGRQRAEGRLPVAGLRLERRRLRRACRSNGGELHTRRGRCCTHTSSRGRRLEQQRLRRRHLGSHSSRDIPASAYTQLDDDSHDDHADVEHDHADVEHHHPNNERRPRRRRARPRPRRRRRLSQPVLRTGGTISPTATTAPTGIRSWSRQP